MCPVQTVTYVSGRSSSSNYLCGFTMSSQNSFAVSPEFRPLTTLIDPQHSVGSDLSQGRAPTHPATSSNSLVVVSRKRPWLNARRCYVLLSSSSDDYSKCL